MKWYKKQLAEKLKEIDKEKNDKGKEVANKPSRHTFDSKKILGNKKNFANPVAAMNRNRKKTDLP